MDRRAWIAIGGLVASAALFTGVASAGTLAVTGGPGLDVGSMCPTSDSTCPPIAIFPPPPPYLSLQGTDNPVSGSFTYNPTLNQVSFSITLTQSAPFSGTPGSETLESGTVISGVVTVGAPSVTGVVQEIGSGTGSATLYTNLSSQPVQDSSISISGLHCTTVGSGQCGFDAGTGGLSVAPVGGASYDAALAIDANVSSVPLPAGAWLLMAGLGGLVAARRGSWHGKRLPV